MQVLFGALVLFTVRTASGSAVPTHFGRPKDIIFDTDLLSFPDDFGALALGNAFEQLGQAHILGMVSDVNSRYSIPAMDAINTYYNHPNIPFAQNRSVTNETAEPTVNSSTAPAFVKTIANYSLFPEDIHDGSNNTISTPLDFYQRTLSQAEDQSVTIIAIGFLNYLDELYHSEGGKKLIETKVAELVVQGGDFSPSPSGPHRAGYNLGAFLGGNLTAAKVLEVWPSPVTYLGSNIGRSVITGIVLANASKSNPVGVAYDPAIFLPSTGIRRGSYDLLATYYGVLGLEEGSFQYGNGDRGGRIEIDLKNGTARWNYDTIVPSYRQQHFLDFKESNVTIAGKVDKLLTLEPKA